MNIQQTIRKVKVTPSMASELLKKNSNNRRINQGIVANYASMMINGKWKEDTFELIKIDLNGNILDGQHRLTAIVKSGISINLHLVDGMEENVFDVLDTGKKRNTTDIFHISGVKNSNIMPSIIKLHQFLLENRNTRHSRHMSNVESLELYNKRQTFYDEIAKCTLTYYNNFSKLVAPQYIGGILSYIADHYDLDYAKRFMTALVNGENNKTNAINLFTKKIIDSRISKKYTMTDTMLIALFLKTFACWRDRKSVNFLKFTFETDIFPFLKPTDKLLFINETK